MLHLNPYFFSISFILKTIIHLKYMELIFYSLFLLCTVWLLGKTLMLTSRGVHVHVQGQGLVHVQVTRVSGYVQVQDLDHVQVQGLVHVQGRGLVCVQVTMVSGYGQVQGFTLVCTPLPFHLPFSLPYSILPIS